MGNWIKCQRLMQRMVSFVCFSILAMHLLSGPQQVESGLERAQFYAGTCLSVDPECTVKDHGVSLGSSPSHLLNLGVHLTGLLPLWEAQELISPKAPQVAKVDELHIVLFTVAIDHPPKA